MPHTLCKQIPLAYSLLSAGPGVQVCDDGFALLDLNFLITGGRENFLAFVITGDSMREDIHPGNIVFVDPNAEPQNGDTVVVNINGENCIKIFERSVTRLYLVPMNDAYPTREVRPTDTFHVLGVVKSHLAFD